MTLWHLLLGMYLSVSVSAAISAAKIRAAGIGSYSLALVIGLTCGLLGAWTMNVAGYKTHTYLRSRPERLQERYYRLLYAGAIAWILMSGLIVGLGSSALLGMIWEKTV